VLVTQNPIAIREGNWKLHTDNNSLYNIASDPAESTNVAASNAVIRTRLQTKLAAIQATPMTSPLLGWWPLDEGTGQPPAIYQVCGTADRSPAARPG
jgi:arylsulfatase A-like enzyme